jgi:SAM-dependent methyltransferase
MDPLFQHDETDFNCEFSEAELTALTDLEGLRVLHLVSGLPLESFALAALGAAEVVVMDADATDQNLILTGPLIELGEGLAGDQQLAVVFTGVGLAEMRDAERDSAFDLVYAGPTTLAWTANLNDWAVDVAEALRPGGRFILHDEHPAARALEPVGEESSAGENQDLPVDEEWTLEELKAELESNGLVVERLESLYGPQRFLTTLDTLEEAPVVRGALRVGGRRPE